MAGAWPRLPQAEVTTAGRSPPHCDAGVRRALAVPPQEDGGAGCPCCQGALRGPPGWRWKENMGSAEMTGLSSDPKGAERVTTKAQARRDAQPAVWGPRS